jgi:hypothetical protein
MWISTLFVWADCGISTLCAAEFVAQTGLLSPKVESVVSKSRKSLIPKAKLCLLLETTLSPKEKAVLDEEKTGAGIDSARAPVT